ADGFSLDDKRNPVEANDLPDVLARWQNLNAETNRGRTEQSFLVPKADIVAQDYDLSINRYKEVVFEEVETRDPLEIIAELESLEGEIQQGLAELKEMLSGAGQLCRWVSSSRPQRSAELATMSTHSCR